MSPIFVVLSHKVYKLTGVNGGAFQCHDPSPIMQGISVESLKLVGKRVQLLRNYRLKVFKLNDASR